MSAMTLKQLDTYIEKIIDDVACGFRYCPAISEWLASERQKELDARWEMLVAEVRSVVLACTTTEEWLEAERMFEETTTRDDEYMVYLALHTDSVVCKHVDGLIGEASNAMAEELEVGHCEDDDYVDECPYEDPALDTLDAKAGFFWIDPVN